MQRTKIWLLTALALASALLVTQVLAGAEPTTHSATPAPAGSPSSVPAAAATIAPVLLYPGEERHLRNVRQLTFGHSQQYANADFAANFAEAYWSPDQRHLILQASFDQWRCDQLFELDLLTGGLRLVNDGAGRVTCGYYTADGRQCIYSCTAENGGPGCPEKPDYAKLGYVWPVYSAYDVYLADVATGQVLRNLTQHPGYDAEATIDWHTGWMYFTSLRENDLDVYRMQLDSGEVQRLTDEYGYDGGPFISYDGKTVVYRHAIFKSDAEREDYANLLEQNLIRPGDLEIMAMDADGSNKRQLTDYGASSFAPFLHPDNKTVIFCSNLSEPGSRFFDLYTVPLSGGALERITTYDGFDGFPMFSPDGKYLVWCSNRDDRHPGETNAFIAEWIP